MRRTIITLVAAFAVLLGACTGIELSQNGTDDSIVDAGGPGIFAAAAAVQPFGSCDDFLDHVKTHALERVGPWGLIGHEVFYGDVVFAVAEERAGDGDDFVSATTTVPASGGVEGVDYSGTNVQVLGVDEPDVVKTDGERIFAIAQGRLFWIDVTGDSPEIVASLPLDGWGHQLFLSGDRLLLTTSGGGYGVLPVAGQARSTSIAPGGGNRTVINEIDVTDPSAMAVLRTMTMDGSIVSSRMTDEVVRIVSRSAPVGLAWVYPEGEGIRAEQKATERNREIIEESTLENWVPWVIVEDHTNGTTSDGPLLGCEQVGYPEDFSGLSMLSILSVDLEDGLQPGNAIGLLAEGQTVYSSMDNLYVAATPFTAWPVEALGTDEVAPSTPRTIIHQFDISDPRTARYVASGDVEGVLHSQFSLDEYDGTLRVVVTDQPQWGGGGNVPETSVVALQTSGTELVEVGSVGGLGKNEHVYSVRFIADKAYVVTFRQVDPLYVVDLSNPRDPRVTGELKINGYSAYLHPIGEDLLLGVGQDATDEGRILGTQVSVFDVTNPEDPRRMSRLTFESAHSDAEWDHHAFLWWAPQEIAVLPLQRWSFDEARDSEDFFSGAVVINASTNRVTQVGEIRHPSLDDDECVECGFWTAPIVRSLVINDVLFTISENGIMASDLDTLDELSWTLFG